MPWTYLRVPESVPIRRHVGQSIQIVALQHFNDVLLGVGSQLLNRWLLV